MSKEEKTKKSIGIYVFVASLLLLAVAVVVANMAMSNLMLNDVDAYFNRIIASFILGVIIAPASSIWGLRQMIL
ncbi:MAG: hypothetical protein WC682_02180 [Parcubacteria group bacterium]|jgi:hypothetical protein